MKIRNVKIVSILIVCLCFIFGTSAYAASVSLSGNSSGDPNSKITITVGGDFTGRVNLSASNGTLSASSVWIESNSQSVTVTLGASGTTTVTATPQEGSSTPDGELVTVPAASKSISIKQPVKEPATQQQTNPPANTGTTTNKPTTNTNTNTNKNTNTNTKSSNANLKNLILNVEGLSPAFAKNITNYSLNVGENVDNIKVTASVEHSKATYSVRGNTNLKEGENVITIRVVAENGAVKKYNINVLKSGDPVKSDATLSSLIIEDVDLGQTFDPNVTEYNAGDINVKADKLNIYAYTSSDNAMVEIIGNENLNVGENKITIRVTSENGKIVKDYIVSFNKLYEKEEENEVVEKNPSKTIENKTTLGDRMTEYYTNNIKPNSAILILYLFIWIEFIQVVYLYNRLKKYEDLDKITVGKRIKQKNIKEKKVKENIEKARRKKENPIFPDEE